VYHSSLVLDKGGEKGGGERTKPYSPGNYGEREKSVHLDLHGDGAKRVRPEKKGRDAADRYRTLWGRVTPNSLVDQLAIRKGYVGQEQKWGHLRTTVHGMGKVAVHSVRDRGRGGER